MEYSRRSRPYRSKLGSQMEFRSHVLLLYFHSVSFRLPFLPAKTAIILRTLLMINFFSHSFRVSQVGHSI